METENKNLKALWRDYDCPQLPDWRDPMTIRTLDKIVEDIQLGRLSESEFLRFVRDNLGTGDFALGCSRYVAGKVRPQASAG